MKLLAPIDSHYFLQKSAGLLIILTTFFLSACASPKLDDYTRYNTGKQALHVSKEKTNIHLKQKNLVQLRGMYDYDNSLDSGGMLYPILPSLIGVGIFAAQLAVQGAISSSVKNKKLAKQQKEANEVIAPFDNILKDFKQRSLTHDSDNYKFINDTNISSGIILVSNPIFFLSQDLSALSLIHVVSIHSSSAKDKAIYQNLIEVISPKIDEEDPYHILYQNDGSRLKEVIKDLYKYSLTLALADARNEYKNGGESHQKSFRFYQGKQLRIERGFNIDNDCEKNIVRNLRGWLIAYPVIQDEDNPLIKTYDKNGHCWH